MKKLLISILILITFIFLINTSAFATGRLVDIPVPPGNRGMLNSEEENSENQEQYETNNVEITTEANESSNMTAQDYISKSPNNYLKSLSVEGYNLEPEFVRENDTYTIYVKDRENLKNLNISAEADDETAQIEGTGSIEITPEQESVTINVIAENGNLKVYKINIEDEENKPKETASEVVSDAINRSGNMKVIIGVFIIFVIFIIVIIIIARKKKKMGKLF